jgi:hypothetical protein
VSFCGQALCPSGYEVVCLHALFLNAAKAHQQGKALDEGHLYAQGIGHRGAICLVFA